MSLWSAFNIPDGLRIDTVPETVQTHHQQSFDDETDASNDTLQKFFEKRGMASKTIRLDADRFFPDYSNFLLSFFVSYPSPILVFPPSHAQHSDERSIVVCCSASPGEEWWWLTVSCCRVYRVLP